MSETNSPANLARARPWALRSGLLLVVLVGVYTLRTCGLLDTEPAPIPRPAPAPTAPDRSSRTASVTLNATIPDVTIRDLEGKIAYQGVVNLSATLERIERGERLAFRNDGAAFGNREGRLPRKPDGYYEEWVHPTPKLSGPGPQRIVTGKGGEIFYTADHYKSFRQLK